MNYYEIIMVCLGVIATFYLVRTLTEASALIQKTSSLVDNLNKEIPEILRESHEIATNLNATSKVISDGANQVAVGAEKVKSLNMQSALMFLKFARKGLSLINKLTGKGVK